MEGLNLDIKKYLDMAKRRVYWIVIPFLAVLLAGLVYVLRAEPVYEAETLILVQPQEVPQSYVRSVVQRGVGERLRTITQQVTSRTNLETIIDEHGLYEDTEMMLESKVASCRKSIQVNVGGGRGGGSTFGITFRHTDPEKAKNVTNALASNFISENLKIRESQALGTSSFLADELESVRRRLEKREEALKEYRMAHMGAMPDQLETNLRMLERTQSQLEQLNESLQDARNRKLMLQEQAAQQKRMAEQMAQFSGTESLFDESELMSEESQELASLRDQLETLKMRYTENHPDVRRVQAMIDKLEAKAEKAQEEAAEAAAQEPDPLLEPEEPDMAGPDMNAFMPSAADMLKPQLDQINYEIQGLRADIAKAKERIELYQRRVEETPRIEQEVLELKRDYSNLKDLYDSLLSRKLESEISVSMEKKQKGEQFRILDPAKRPELPVEPDVRRIFLLTLVLGIGLGGGLAYLREMMDTSYKEPQEAGEHLGLPVLISLPLRYTEQEERARKRKAWLKAAGIIVAFSGTAAGIMVAFKGFHKTLEFVKGLLPFVGGA
jgi:polysaccharide chain length determinant protein (PEP-CTERM system associated)